MFLKSHQIITSYDQIIDLLIHGWDKIINFLEEVVGFYIGYMLFLAWTSRKYYYVHYQIVKLCNCREAYR